MPEAYVVEAVRTAVGKKTDRSPACTRSIWACTHCAVCSTGSTSIRRGRRRHRRLRRRASAARPATSAATAWLAAGYPEEVPGVTVDRQCGSSQQAISLWRTGDPVRHRGHHPGRRHAEHEPDPDRVGDGGRQGVRVHLADQRVGELAAPLRRPGDLPVPRRRADRREMEHLPRGDGAVRARQPPACVQPAIRGGHFENEIIGVGDFRIDEGPRETSLEKMAGLQTLVEAAG